MTLTPSPAYGGGGASAQQRSALRPAPLHSPPSLASPPQMEQRWSRLAERRPLLRPPVRLEIINKNNESKNVLLKGFFWELF